MCWKCIPFFIHSARLQPQCSQNTKILHWSTYSIFPRVGTLEFLLNYVHYQFSQTGSSQAISVCLSEDPSIPIQFEHRPVFRAAVSLQLYFTGYKNFESLEQEAPHISGIVGTSLLFSRYARHVCDWAPFSCWRSHIRRAALLCKGLQS